MIGMVPTECDRSLIRNRLTPHKHGPTIVHNLILALFKHVEIHTKRVIKRHLPSIDSKKLFAALVAAIKEAREECERNGWGKNEN